MRIPNRKTLSGLHHIRPSWFTVRYHSNEPSATAFDQTFGPTRQIKSLAQWYWMDIWESSQQSSVVSRCGFYQDAAPDESNGPGNMPPLQSGQPHRPAAVGW
jgi:hypothetical protein